MDLSNIENLFFLFLLVLVAFLYSSVGHGGASGYLAVLALFSIPPALMKSSSLILNIAVSFVSFYQYYREGYFKGKLFLPFAISSTPASFIGAMISLSDNLYKKILGICLLLPIIRFAGFSGNETEKTKDYSFLYALLIGATIGLLSGMIGIGGGILLSPILLLLHWSNMKETAAISALFIFVNSISGLIGLLIKGTSISNEVYIWLAAALVGGIVGAYMGSKKFDSVILRYILTFVLIIASVKLLFVK